VPARVISYYILWLDRLMQQSPERHLLGVQRAQAVGQAPRWDQALPPELASGYQDPEERECPAGVYRDKECRTWQFSPSLSTWRRNIGHVVGLRLPMIRWGAVFWNRIKLWEFR
jgi:hypothetical protein